QATTETEEMVETATTEDGARTAEMAEMKTMADGAPMAEMAETETTVDGALTEATVETTVDMVMDIITTTSRALAAASRASRDRTRIRSATTNSCFEWYFLNHICSF
ncbi:hypothetical protein PMAYCL1PPCAC_26022, partial [Pristionchus mayeri]